MTERFITLADGRRIALLDNGRQGRPLLVALRLARQRRQLSALAPHLEAFHLVCLDLPGHGHSDHW